MKKTIASYRNMTYEQRLAAVASVMIYVSAATAAGKIALGLFSDYALAAVGVFSAFLVAAKGWCLAGIGRAGKTGKEYHGRIAVCVGAASAVYLAYMVADAVFAFSDREYSQWIAISVAFFSFADMGIAVYGLVRTRRRGHYFRDMKIIHFISAMNAILTAQIALLSFTQGGGGLANSLFGAGIGVVSLLLALYIRCAPKISVIDREHNVFVLKETEKNRLIDMTAPRAEVVLAKSRVYGDYVCAFALEGNRADGYIEKRAGMWKRMHVFWKIVCVVLSEILVFAWLAGYAAYFARTVNLPDKLKRKMRENGFLYETSPA